MPAPNANTDWVSNPRYNKQVGTQSPTYIETPILPAPPIEVVQQNNDIARGGNTSQGSGRTIGFGNTARPIAQTRTLLPISGNISVGAASQTPNLALILAAVVAIFIFRKQSKRRR